MIGLNGGTIGVKNVVDPNGVNPPISDPFYNNVGLILNGGDFVDGSKYQATITNTSISLDSGNPIFGNASYKFDSDSDVLAAPDQGQFDLSTNDFTIEGWMYPINYDSSFQCIFQKRIGGSASTSKYIYFAARGSDFSVYISSNGTTWDIAQNQTLGVTPPTKVWTHYAVCRQGSSIRFFIGGTLATTITTSLPIFNDPSSIFEVGTDAISGCYDYGRLGGIRVTNGVARYTANFTPPTSTFGVGTPSPTASGSWTLAEQVLLKQQGLWVDSNP